MDVAPTRLNKLLDAAIHAKRWKAGYKQNQCRLSCFMTYMGWRITKTPGGAFRLVTIQFIAYRLILAVLIMDLP